MQEPSKSNPDKKKNNWETPDALFGLINSYFGPFDLDTAASAENAKTAIYLTEQDDGLSVPWWGNVWCNIENDVILKTCQTKFDVPNAAYSNQRHLTISLLGQQREMVSPLGVETVREKKQREESVLENVLQSCLREIPTLREVLNSVPNAEKLSLSQKYILLRILSSETDLPPGAENACVKELGLRCREDAKTLWRNSGFWNPNENMQIQTRVGRVSAKALRSTTTGEDNEVRSLLGTGLTSSGKPVSSGGRTDAPTVAQKDHFARTTSSHSIHQTVQEPYPPTSFPLAGSVTPPKDTNTQRSGVVVEPFLAESEDTFPLSVEILYPNNVWVNPPYSNIAAWIKKGYEEAAAGNCTVTMLVGARPDTQYWWDYARHAEVIFIKGRITFKGAKQGADFPSAILHFSRGLWKSPSTTYWNLSVEQRR